MRFMIVNGQLSGALICKCEKVSKWEEMIMHIFATVYTRAGPIELFFWQIKRLITMKRVLAVVNFEREKWKKVSSRDYCINWQSSSDENMESFYVDP